MEKPQNLATNQNSTSSENNLLWT